MALVCACTRFVLPSLFTRKTPSRLAKFHTIGKFTSKLLTAETACIKTRIPQKRSYFWIFKRRTNREVQLVDNPPKNYELIYRCNMDNLFLTFQHLGFYLAAVLCVSIVFNCIEEDRFKFKPDEDEDTEPQRTKTGDIALSAENQAHLMLGAFFVVFCTMHWYISKIPVRIYYSPDSGKYLMYLYGALPTKMKTVKVAPGELVEKTGSVINLWRYEMVEHKKTKEDFLLLEEYFKYPADLYVLLGQQPQRSANVPIDDDELGQKRPK